MLRETIKESLASTVESNEAKTKQYKSKLLKKLDKNLKKGQTKEENQGIIDRFVNASPQQLTPMQQAFKEAL